LTLPLRRWESSLLRANPEDKLIDAWISLEALFLPNKADELSYRAALRLAAFLGDDPGQRDLMYKQVPSSYWWRSQVVHGSTPTPQRARKQALTSLDEAVRVTGKYLRLTLLKILSLTGRFNPDDIEAQLLKR